MKSIWTRQNNTLGYYGAAVTAGHSLPLTVL